MGISTTNSIGRLHLGCGRTILSGWVNLDAFHGEGVDVVADLDRCVECPLPFDSDSFDEILGNHLFEHIRNPLPMMEELYRIAKPGAMLTFRVPYGSSDDAFEDPTHVRQCFLGTFDFFAQPTYWRADYGYRGDWQPMVQSLLVSKEYGGRSWQEILDDVRRYRNVVKEMTVEMKAIKPMRKALLELRESATVNCFWEN